MGGEGAVDRLVVLASEDLGGRHQGRLAAPGRHVGHGAHGDHGLARAHVALDQPAHPLAGGEVGADVAQRPLLGAGEGEGQVGADAFGHLAGGDRRGGLAAALGLALGHGQLLGQELVIGQAPPGRRLRRDVGLGFRIVQPRQCLTPGRQALPRPPGAVLPFRQLRSSLQGLLHEPAHRAGGQAGRRRIDRLQLGDLGRLVRRQHVVGVDDLPAVALVFDLAGDDAADVRRMPLLQLGAEAAEEDQGHEAGFVEHPHAPGLLRAARLLEGLHGDLEGHHLAVAGGGDGGRRAAHQRMGLEEQDVADDRAGQLRQQWGHARAHPLEGGDGRIKREQNLRPHACSIADWRGDHARSISATSR